MNNDCKPCFKENNIAVVFASDEKYTPYLSVALQSVLNHASEKYNYDILIMGDGISEESEQKLRSMTDGRNNCSVRVIDCRFLIPDESSVGGAFKVNSYYSVVTYFRLFTPELFVNFDKILYLDCDVLACANVAELFNVDLGEAYFAGVPDVGMLESAAREDIAAYLCSIGFPDPFRYLQAGVILFNLVKMRQDHLQQTLLAHVKSRRWKWFDQDVLNVVCRGKTKKVDWSWNVLCGALRLPETSLRRFPAELSDFLSSAENNIRIIHFANEPRPWNDLSVFMARTWWDCARRTPFFFELISRLAEKNERRQSQGRRSCLLKNWKFGRILPEKVRAFLRAFFQR